MNGAKFTPGPWRADGGVVELRPGDDMSRMVVPGRSLDEGEANARLIAAAPDLYAGLHEVKPLLVWLAEGHRGTRPDVLDFWLTRATAALAKAEGR